MYMCVCMCVCVCVCVSVCVCMCICIYLSMYMNLWGHTCVFVNYWWYHQFTYYCYSGDYQQMLHCALSNSNIPIKTLPPCMIKPQRLWSGKQVDNSIMWLYTHKPCHIPSGNFNIVAEYHSTEPEKTES